MYNLSTETATTRKRHNSNYRCIYPQAHPYSPTSLLTPLFLLPAPPSS